LKRVIPLARVATERFYKTRSGRSQELLPEIVFPTTVLLNSEALSIEDEKK
jgi:hypothetical protein